MNRREFIGTAACAGAGFMLALGAMLLALAGCRTRECPVDSKTTFARDALMKFIDSGEIPGAISVFHRDGVQETACLGFADREERRPISMDDLFMQCSQTKGFCGVTIAMLVEEGKVGLDDPVSKFLPEFKVLWIGMPETNGIRRLVPSEGIWWLFARPFRARGRRRDGVVWPWRGVEYKLHGQLAPA